MGYCFMAVEGASEQTAATIVIQDSVSGYIAAAAVPHKGPHVYSLAFLKSYLDDVGYPRDILQSDGEPSVISLGRALVKERSKGSKDIQTQIAVRQSPPGDHTGKGLAEPAVIRNEGMKHTSRLSPRHI